MRSTPSLYTVAFSILAIFLAYLAIPRFPSLASLNFRSRPMPLRTAAPRVGNAAMRYQTAASTDTAKPAPKEGEVYFLSHGGPPTMFDTNNPAYKAWQKYGKIVEQANPKGLVVVSAHWEADNGPGVFINEDGLNPLVYDFYGFPKNYYEQKFHSKGNPVMLDDIKGALQSAGVEVTGKKRGLDHGVWVPFLVAFEGKTAIPIIQVSLPGDSSPVSAAKLGRALAPLREKGYGIMGTGQVVHNLRDYMTGGSGSYGPVFLKATEDALKSSDPAAEAVNLFRHPTFRQAHPTPEHLLPLVVAAAALKKGDQIHDIFTKPDGALSWGMWSWSSPSTTPAASA